MFFHRLLHTSPVMSKIVAGKYKVTLDQSKPLTYEMAVQPDHIGIHKSFNSFNTGQLEDSLGYKKWQEKGGTLLSYKLFMEDLFIRKYNKSSLHFLTLTLVPTAQVYEGHMDSNVSQRDYRQATTQHDQVRCNTLDIPWFGCMSSFDDLQGCCPD